MKKMNQNHRGEVCGQVDRRYRPDRPGNQGEAFWAKKRGERKLVAGGSLVELEKKLARL